MTSRRRILEDLAARVTTPPDTAAAIHVAVGAVLKAQALVDTIMFGEIGTKRAYHDDVENLRMALALFYADVSDRCDHCGAVKTKAWHKVCDVCWSSLPQPLRDTIWLEYNCVPRNQAVLDARWVEAHAILADLHRSSKDPS